jgi:hypothetical protein
LRRLRLAAPTQLVLVVPEAAPTAAQRWWSLPDGARMTALSLLVRMIVDGVVEEEGENADDDAR